jgi:hypothetical protein
MLTLIDDCVSERSLSMDRALPVIETESHEANGSFVQCHGTLFLAPVSPHTANLDDLEFSDIGRDPRFTNGGWLGLAIMIAVALCVVYIGFISAWILLPLTVVW